MAKGILNYKLSHPCHPRDGDDCFSAIFFAFFCLKICKTFKNVGIFAQKRPDEKRRNGNFYTKVSKFTHFELAK